MPSHTHPPINRLTGHWAVKTAASVLLILCAMGLVLSSLALLFCYEKNAYSDSPENIHQREVDRLMTVLSHQAFQDYIHFYQHNPALLEDQGNRLAGTNFYYALYDEAGHLRAGAKPAFTPLYQSELELQHEAWADTDDQAGEEATVATYTLYGYVDGQGDARDVFSWHAFAMTYLIGRRWVFPWLTVILTVFCLALAGFLGLSAGRRVGQRDLATRRLDRFPLDLLLLLLFVFSYALVEAILNSVRYGALGASFNASSAVLAAVLGAVALLVILLLGLLVLMTVAVRLKTGTILRQTLLYRWLWRPLAYLGKMTCFVFSKIPLIWKSALFLGFWLIYEIWVLANQYWLNWFFLWLLGKLILTATLLLFSAGLGTIRKGTQELVAGNLTHEIDSIYLMPDLKAHARDLSQISQGLSHALDERMKSERFKTELITNVSHDIKTPLTSIINYVDLMKQHMDDPEKTRAYLAIVDRHSQRLKKLTEDLIEASKASTGTVSVQLQALDAGVLLTQVAGEYEEKMTQSQLQLITQQPDKPLYLSADSRLLWRIMDNIFSNACLYSQPQTRVYASLEEQGRRAVITVKNTSKEPLNLSSEALMERFVRGDRSRSSQGSGLGLSIASSLTTLQGGSFDLQIDGDLFKAIVAFPIASKQSANGAQAL